MNQIQFKCKKCGYTADLLDENIMVCNDCKELIVGNACPYCYGKNLSEWNDSDPCPKCYVPTVIDEILE